MRKPIGWRNEPQRHSLAARGISTTMRSRGMETSYYTEDSPITFGSLQETAYELMVSAKNGDVDAMQEFIIIADEIIVGAENIGLGREKYIRKMRKAQSNVERALADQNFMYKYLKQTWRPYLLAMDPGDDYQSKADNDCFNISLYGSYGEFKIKLKNLKMRSEVL